jgi:hypothetical protein
MLAWYRVVMNSEVNPLRNLHPAFRFQIMAVLGTMWTVIFCMASSAWVYYGELIAVHLLMAAGTLITGATFKAAENGTLRGATYRDFPTKDGTARYDDVWGA